MSTLLWLNYATPSNFPPASPETRENDKQFHFHAIFNMALRRCVGGETAALGLECTSWPILLSSVSSDGVFCLQHGRKKFLWDREHLWETHSIHTSERSGSKTDKWPLVYYKYTELIWWQKQRFWSILCAMYTKKGSCDVEQENDGMEENNVTIRVGGEAEALQSPTSSAESGMRGMKW